jgi:hypothetical protein
MKILFLSLLTAGLGAGWLGLAAGGESTTGAAAAPECQLTFECTPRGTCLVTCHDETGAICCQEELDCERDCAPQRCSPPPCTGG